MGYRHSSAFCAPTPVNLDRNQRAKLLARAEAIERKTKSPGRRSGVLGLSGLHLYRVLLLKFASAKGCWPSYATLQRHTGLCRQTIAKGLMALKACGLLTIQRRLQRIEVRRTSPITGLPERYVGTVQASSSYDFPTADSRIVVLPHFATSKPFPRKREESFETLLARKLGLLNRLDLP